MQIKNFIRSYWKSISVICCILYLSFAPPSTFKGIPTFENEDKLIHFLMYSGLTLMLIYDLRNNKKVYHNFRNFIFVCVVFPCLLGGLIEILQPTFFAPRSASWADFFCNDAGVIMGLTTMQLLRKLIKIV
jgi:VanZ family protein